MNNYKKFDVRKSSKREDIMLLKSNGYDLHDLENIIRYERIEINDLEIKKIKSKTCAELFLEKFNSCSGEN